MRKYSPNATDVKQGPGGYELVTLPGFGLCWATLRAFDETEYRGIHASVLGWHRGDNLVFWRDIPEAARRKLWETLEPDELVVAIRVLGRDPYPAAA